MAARPTPRQSGRASIALVLLAAFGEATGTYVGAALVVGALVGIALLAWWLLTE